MVNAATARPLGRVPMPTIPRFPDKLRGAVQPAVVDLATWLMAGEAISTATVGVLPAVLGAVAVTAPSIAGTQVQTVLSDGVEGMDFAVVFTVTTSANRTGVFVWRVYVPPLVAPLGLQTNPLAPSGASAASGDGWGLEFEWPENSGLSGLV